MISSADHAGNMPRITFKGAILSKTDPYTGIAEAYDYILRHVDYQLWFEFISDAMIIYCNNPETVLELGCGTGKFGAKFSSRNFNIVGIDKSIQMLMVAKTRAFRNFRIICSDIRNFVLKQKFDFIFCVHDTMNYLTDKDDIRSVLRSVKAVMHKGSIFMFDITTEHNIERFFNNKTSVYKTRGLHIEWGNSYDRENKIITSRFKTTDKEGSVYREEHIQKIYSVEEITEIVESEGFTILHICSDYTFDPPSPDTVMINFITEKKS